MVISSEELYRKLESEYRISTGGNRYFDSCEAKNNRELVHFNNERCLLYSYKNNFSSFLSIDNEAELAEYCSQRLQRTKNIHLKCIYSFKLKKCKAIQVANLTFFCNSAQNKANFY